MKKKWYCKAMAGLLAATLLVSICGCANPEPGEPDPNLKQQEVEQITPATGPVSEQKGEVTMEGTATAIKTAQYPQMSQYPETDGFNVDEEAYKAWRDDRRAQEPLTDTYKEGIREFTEETLKQYLSDTEGKNLVYSPLNVYMALAMLAEVTDGESREQILKALHVTSIEHLREKVTDLWNANYCEDGTVSSLLAGSVWLSDSIKYKEETLNTLAETYYASSYSGTMGSEEYNKLLQAWLNEQTGGLLEKQISSVEMDPQTVLALATTVYYRAKWGDKFSKDLTKQDVFHTKAEDIRCDFMHDSSSGNYYWGENFAAVIRDLEQSGDMMFFLPDEGVSPEELLQDEEVLNFIFDLNARSNVKHVIINQAVPKFDVTSEIDLVDGLKDMGITDVFSFDTSDFTPLTEDTAVAVSSAEHVARVMIDEDGCVATAYTVMLAYGAARPPKDEVDFILNRPFLFVLNGQDGQPLFIGIVNHP